MKRVFSIALVVLLLLNVLGYYGIFVGLQYHNSINLTQRFDNGQYDRSQEMTIKIPVAIPYAVDAPDFERVDGEFEYQGEVYRLVKQRLSKDTLYMVCIKDNDGKRITQALNDYVKSFSDKTSDHGKSHVNSVPTFIKDYIPSALTMGSSSQGWSSPIVKQECSVVFIPTFCTSIVHPPDRA